ncbi:MAG: PQQ-dependent sugar dehydrogenase [Sandaracinaceae bacterium]|nr:PQQ-dependent sugar dehydrogenase [Sandaracinaceae bacterium]
MRLSFEALSLPSEVILPTASGFLPDGTLLVASHPGTIHHLSLGERDATLLGSFSVVDGDFRNEGDCGVLQLEVDPRWSENHFVWIGHCGANTESLVRRVTFDGTRYDGVDETLVETLRVTGPRVSNNHSVGHIGFEDDGTTMWVVIGDKATETGQRTDRMIGALLRIVPNRDAAGSGYVPAAGNAFDGSTADRPEIYAWGLRYGWRATRDRMGRIWVGDVGEAQWEEIDLIDGVGLNFGWADCDGPCEPAMAGFTDPLLAWRRGDTAHRYFVEDPESEPSTRRVAWVGEAYRPGEDDRYDGFLTDRVPFGDTCLGWVRGAWADATGAVVYDEHWAHLPHITSWEQSPDGYVYVTSFGSCDAFEVFDPPALYRVTLRP